ncbi:heavy metal-associated isoprenylated plant protein 35-like [Salvia divinorum]|uniref:Heavy metal-associated isoprenylated plant protein 35-like n=1 Tax=Salvia divinorum TaxID=28513 RepID=A0ABD1H040_SALDI
MAEEPIKHLKTTIIKASIHCQGCKRKVHKILSQIQGVEHVDVDAQQHKVTVKGNVNADALIKKLIKSGKNAQLWPQEKITPIPANGNKKDIKTQEKVDAVEAPPASGDEGKATETAADSGGGDVSAPSVKKTSAGAQGKKSEVENKSEESCSAAPEKKEAVEKSNGGGNDGESTKKKKMKKKRVQLQTDGGLENREANESPSCHHHFPPPAAAQPVCAVSYNTAYPSSSYTAAYYTAPPPQSHAYMHQMEAPPLDSELNQPQPLDSFEMFSDENPNGCFIM